MYWNLSRDHLGTAIAFLSSNERPVFFGFFFFVSSMKMRVKSHPMIDWKDCVALAATSNSNTGRVILVDVGKPLLHLPFEAAESVVDAPKAAAVHSV